MDGPFLIREENVEFHHLLRNNLTTVYKRHMHKLKQKPGLGAFCAMKQIRSFTAPGAYTSQYIQ